MYKFKYSLNIPTPLWATHSLFFTSGVEGRGVMHAVYIGGSQYQYYGSDEHIGILDESPVDIYGEGWDAERWVNEIKDNGPYTLTDLRAVEENE